MTDILLDATVLANFALVGRPDLVYELWPGHTATTAEAMAEFRQGAEQGLFPANAWQHLAVIALQPDEEELARQLPGRLGNGERSCLAVAIVRGMGIATDDRLARQLAQRHQISLTGTLGILAACVQLEMLTLQEANALLRRMIQAGYRSPVERLNDLVGR